MKIEGKTTPTAYRILQRHEAGVWTERELISAASAETAIRKYVESVNSEAQKLANQATPASGTFVAIPARSFSPVTVETEVTHRVKLVGAGNAAPAHPRDPKDEAA